MRVCTWDIEATDLDGEFGRIITSAVKPYGDEPECIINKNVFNRRTEKSKRDNDHQFVVRVREQLEQFDIIVTWYGGSFHYDLPMLNTRLMAYGEERLAPRFHLDLWNYSKRSMKLKSHRLDRVAGFFGVSSKTYLDPQVWVNAAMQGDKEAQEYIVEHNIEDVITLEHVYDVFMRYDDIVKQLRRI